jgi:citrate lyase gamma subunit
MPAASTANPFLEAIKTNADKAKVFKDVKITSKGVLQCSAKASAEPAWYRVDKVNDAWRVSLVTADRWLSESIEADLMHFGDPIEELIEEELVELGFKGAAPVVKHFRSDDMLYTFISEIPGVDEAKGAKAVETASRWLLAYEAAFRELGDMEGD